MALSFKDVAEVLKIIEASSCDELILELEGTRLVVRRNGAASGAPAVEAAAAAAPAAGPDRPGSESAAPAAVDDGRVAVRAPMVGSFYRSPAPDEPPFVELGGRVAAGDALCLIEVMKLFTTIEAPVAGRVADIGVEDAGMVEYDQLLFVIEPDA